MTGSARASGIHGRCHAEKPAYHHPGRDLDRGRARRAVCALHFLAKLRAVRSIATLDIIGERGCSSGHHRAARTQDRATRQCVSQRCPRFATDFANGIGIRCAGCATPAHGLRVLARIPQPRHRQLVSRRDQAGSERCRGAVALRAGTAHARARPAYAALCRGACSTGLDGRFLCSRRRAAQLRCQRDRAVWRARARHRCRESWRLRLFARASAGRSRATGQQRRVLRESRARWRFAIFDSYRRAPAGRSAGHR